MSDYHDIVKQGYLKVKSKKMGMWQKKWLIMRQASSKGPNRLERYADEKASMISYEAKTMDLTYVERVDRMPMENRNHVIMLWFTNGENKQFAASSDWEAAEWHNVITEHSGPAVRGHVSHGAISAASIPRDMFHVYLLPNTNTEYSGEYLMQINSESIILRDPIYHDQVLVTWKLNTLRRYGRDGTKFTFESGRSSETGEGLFIFTSVDCERIYQKVHTATQALVTVKNMTRRQQDGTIPEGTVLTITSNISRHLSEPEPVKGANGNLRHQDSIRSTNSLPVSPNRGPVPVPRNLSTKSDEQPDANANTQYLYSTTNENRTPAFTQQLSTTSMDRPLPPAPFSTSYDNGIADEREYIYEEKGLSADFRQFLSGRKMDDESC